MKKAIILLSGGLDSTTTLYFAQQMRYRCYCLIFDYGQRHRKEIRRAVSIAKRAGCEYYVVKITLPWKGSALLDSAIAVPERRKLDGKSIRVTYVPARNIIFLSFAASFAEVVGAEKIFIGANAVDYSGYPDCRPEFFRAYSKVLDIGLKSGTQNRRRISIETPLVYKTKAQIVKLALRLRVPLKLTWSCYQGGRTPCRRCDSCRLRQKGFEEAGIKE